MIRLGFLNLVYVFVYRILIKFKLHKVQKITHEIPQGRFYKFKKLKSIPSGSYNYQKIVSGYYPFSSKFVSFKNKKINWHKNYFNGHTSSNKRKNWWLIDDFNNKTGDIKTLWELSRFDWIIHLLLSDNQDKHAVVSEINQRINNWVKENPPYLGENWKCGQEASIRVLNLATGLILTDQIKTPSAEIISLIEMHLKRIYPTINYAIAQDNNHGTSEAAALFIGGDLLYRSGKVQYFEYFQLGKKRLQERANKLFSEDGCFSQYSTNYHRLALDTYSICETYRKIHDLTPFKPPLYNKINASIKWLETLVNETNGEVPNLGSNDGALLFNFFNDTYVDYRRTVQWANLVFCQRMVYEFKTQNKSIYNRLGIDLSKSIIGKIDSHAIIEGNKDGILIIKKQKVLLVFRRPVFRFRPSQSDVFHLDLWIDGRNILRDAGTFSYNTSEEKINYYSGDFSHNTVWFNNQMKMPKLSRFLFSNWIREKTFDLNNSLGMVNFSSSYKLKTVSHKRAVKLEKNKLVIVDYLDLKSTNATINWRLENKNWHLAVNDLQDSIEIDLNSNLIHGNVKKSYGKESREYFHEDDVITIQKKIDKSSQIKTSIIW